MFMLSPTRNSSMYFPSEEIQVDRIASVPYEISFSVMDGFEIGMNLFAIIIIQLIKKFFKITIYHLTPFPICIAIP